MLIEEVSTYVNRELARKVENLRYRIGDTPLHHFSRLYKRKGVEIFAKKEWKQLSGSVKARSAYTIFRNAIERGLLTGNNSLLDATSGNTGIAYAAIGKELGVAVTLCLPENASQERKDILRSLGAKVILTSRLEGTDGAQQVARELAEKEPEKYYYANQYTNDGNWQAHFETTAVEIFKELPGTTHFVAGLGTSGTFVGTGRRLKAYNPSIRLISLQPDSALHALEGWKHMETAIIPSIYDAQVADATLEVSTEEAYAMLRDILRQEGLLVSPSSAANIAGAIRVADGLKKGVVVTILPDNADKYGEVIKRIL
jgi:S-sulfo-L-cysteine synthase (O-acetyl-L-serine-dependent)